MTKITLNVKSGRDLKIIENFIGSFDAKDVWIEAKGKKVDKPKSDEVKMVKPSKFKMSKEDALQDIEDCLKEVQLYKEGKLKTRPIEELLNEL